MENVEKLKSARSLLLRLHKALLDQERESYERLNGAINAVQFLNLLIEDEGFSWLRKYSTLIVEIDEMFELDDGISNEMVNANLSKISELMDLKAQGDDFRGKFERAIGVDSDAARYSSDLRTLFSD